MRKGYFVKYTGINASVNHNGQYLNPYNFRPNSWTEVHEKDFEWYKKKAKKNETWHVKEDKVAEVVTKYFAKFLGIPDKKEPMEIVRYEDDSLKSNERKLTFPIGEWVEIKQIDVAFFKKKAVNDFWEYDKRITTEKIVAVKVAVAVAEAEPEPKKKGKSKKEPELELEPEPTVEPVIEESKEDEQ